MCMQFAVHKKEQQVPFFCYRANDSFKIIIITVENERKRQLAQINYHAHIFFLYCQTSTALSCGIFFFNFQGSSSALFLCRLTPAVLINNYVEPRNFNVLTQWRKIWSMRCLNKKLCLSQCTIQWRISQGRHIERVNGKCFFIFMRNLTLHCRTANVDGRDDEIKHS